MLSARVASLFAVAMTMMLASAAVAMPAGKTKDTCIQCFAPPMCAQGCPEGQFCEIIDATCTSCGSASCKPKESTCIQCFAPPMCAQGCPEGQFCDIIDATCTSCGSASCKPKV